MGTILVLVVYLLANLALPFYYRRYRPQEFSVVKHAVLPVLGALAIVVPLYYLAKPGQPTPYNWFPYVALIIVVRGRRSTPTCSTAATPNWPAGSAPSSPTSSHPGRHQRGP